jgi:hypothetical protein
VGQGKAVAYLKGIKTAKYYAVVGALSLLVREGMPIDCREENLAGREIGYAPDLGAANRF